ncbi:MAG TPA: hypothetical protein VF989_13740 [Polyangiaceae bacterium]
MSSITRRLVTSMVVAASLIVASAAVAQPSATDKAAAEALFQEGKRLFESGDYERACGKFTASQELDAGVGTLLYLGECFEKSGKTASAWATFKEAAGMARAQGQNEREQLARDRAQALEARLSHLVVRGPEEVMSLNGLDVRLNGTSVSRASWGSAVPVDPGRQRIEVSAPGYETWSIDVEVMGESSETTVDIPMLLQKTEPAAKPSPAAPSQSEVGVSAGSVADTAPSGGGQRVVGYVVGGLGVAGLAIGTVFGLKAISDNNASADLCRTDTLCSPEGLTKREDARDAATISTLAFTAGVVLAASGVVLVLTAPEAPEAASSGSAPARAASTVGSATARRNTASGLRLELAPLVAPAIGGAVLSGSF